LEMTPSRPMVQAWLYISRPSTSKLSLNWMAVIRTHAPQQRDPYSITASARAINAAGKEGRRP